MNSRGKAIGTGKGIRGRKPQVAPVTKAVRTALALSAIALASVSGTAFACDPPVVVGSSTSVECNDASYLSGIGINAVDDLTVVVGNLGGPVSVTPGFGQVGIGLFATGDASLDVSAGTTISTNGANGIDVFAYGEASVINAGSIYVTGGNGIDVFGLDGASIVNDGVVDVTGSGFLTGLSAVSAYGDVSIVNNGSVRVDSTGVGVGVYGAGAGNISITNNGYVDAYGVDVGVGLAGFSDSGVSIENFGAVYAGSKYGLSAGIFANGDDVDVFNAGFISSTSVFGDAFGVSAYAGYGQASVRNAGDIEAVSFYGTATGIEALGFGGVDVTNTGYIRAVGYTDATGVFAYSAGTAAIDNEGFVRADAKYGEALGLSSLGDDASVRNAYSGVVVAIGEYGATGIRAEAFGTEAFAQNDGLVVADSAYGVATGIEAIGAYGARVVNTGDVYAFGELGAYAIVASGGDGQAVVTNDGFAIAQTRYGYAAGIFAYGETALANNGGTAFAYSQYGDATGMVAEGLSGAEAFNYGRAEALAYGEAIGMRVESEDGTASASNFGLAIARSENGTATGIRVNSDYGTAYAFNAGDAVGIAYNGLGVGISASGYDAVVVNEGGAYGIGLQAGIGIQALGYNSASVTNSGLAYGYGGSYGYGIYAVAGAGGVLVTNSGQAEGQSVGVGFGIYAASAGDTSVVNSGTGLVVGGDVDYSALGVGIYARSSGVGGTASVVNAGEVVAGGYYGGYGIFANASAGFATVDNSGSVRAYSPDYYANGIVAQGALGATVTNSGYVLADGKYAYGIVAISGQGDALVDNSGEVGAFGKYAYGVQAISNLGDAIVDNSGLVVVRGTDTGVGVLAISQQGDVQVDSTGLIDVDGVFQAIGIYARAEYGNAVVNNGGTLYAYSDYGTATGISARGLVADVTNTGDVLAYGYYGATGVYALGFDDALVTNDGQAAAVSYIGQAVGIGAFSPYGNASVDNGGDAVAASFQGDAIGIRAQALYGEALVNNDGQVYAVAKYGDATGIVARGDVATVTGDGLVYALGYYSATGIAAIGYDSASVDVGGSIEVDAQEALGIMAMAYGDVTVASRGSIDAYSGNGNAIGVYAFSYYGDVGITGSGPITVFGQYGGSGLVGFSRYGDTEVSSSGNLDIRSYYGLAQGVVAVANEGTAIASNAGQALVVSTNGDARGVVANGDYALAGNSGQLGVIGYGSATGISAFGKYGAEVDNSGTVFAEAYLGRATALYALSIDGDALVGNSGTASAYSYDSVAFAAYAGSILADATVDNSGTLQASSYNSTAIGAAAIANNGTALVSSSGDISVDSRVGTAVGAFARGRYAEVDNTGSISVTGVQAFGAYAIGTYGAGVSNGGSISAESTNGIAVAAAAFSYAGDASLDNTGDLSAYTFDGVAAGAYVVGYYSATVTNSGSITGIAGDSAGRAYGLVAISDGDITITNSGTISAVHDTVAIAVRMSSDTGTSRLYNSGLVDAGNLGGGSIAVLGSAVRDEIHNTGRINGHIITGDGDDLVNIGASGEWYLGGSSTNLGAGEDEIVNAGLIVLGYGTLYTGDGDDSIVNSGDLVLAYAGIDMGGADTTNTFDNTGTIHAIGSAFIDMGAGGTLVNNGAISFLDGATDDMMTIYGNLAGGGDVNVDIDFIAGTSDMLYITGDITGPQKTINVAAVNLPNTLTFDPIEVVIASGSAAADAFVAGQLFGFESELLDFGLSVEHSVVGTDNVFSIGIEIDGLSNAGNLAVTLAPAVHSLIGTNIGTLRQRVGVLPDLGTELNGLGPWVRHFSSSGGIDATGTGFAAGEDLRFEQDVDGTEVGMNFTVGHGFHYGVMLGKSDNARILSGAAGRDDIELDSVGLYASWLADNFYVDASWRWMEFESKMRSATGEYFAAGDARAFNLEAGYTGWEVGGFSLVPQLQYTRATIDNMASVDGNLTEIALDGGDGERLRLGLGIERSFTTAGGFRVTPYGSINAINEMDGTSSFIVNGNAALSGEVEAGGNYGMAELGIGVQKNGWSANAGVNWADGGAIDSDFGGQVVVRYTW